MKRYAGCLFANGVGDLRNKIVYMAMLIKAHSRDEAVGIAYRTATERWLVRDGWTNHSADVLEITPEWFGEGLQ